jgi:hypothetical protein
MHFAIHQIMFHNGQTDRKWRVLKCAWENTVNARRDRRVQQFSGIFCGINQIAKITANAIACLVKTHVETVRPCNIIVCEWERHPRIDSDNDNDNVLIHADAFIYFFI